MKKLVLVDGMSVLHRAYHAYPLLTTSKGEQVNAVYGFFAILLTVIEKINPTHVLVAWDVGKPTFRHEQYEGYKEKRVKPDQELIDQIGRTREVVEALNIPQFGVEGYEADDVIGTAARQAMEKYDGETEVVIVTGDRDALQLVDDEKVIVWMPSAGRQWGNKDRGPMIYDEEAVKVKFGINPKQIIDLKALMGDASDCIPGVKGVGQVTATKLIQTYGSIENLYEQLLKKRDGVTAVVKERGVKLLEDDKKNAFMSKELATINQEVSITLDWDKCKLNDYDREKAMNLFMDLEFKSLIKKLPKDSWEEDLEEVFG